MSVIRRKTYDYAGNTEPASPPIVFRHDGMVEAPAPAVNMTNVSLYQGLIAMGIAGILQIAVGVIGLERYYGLVSNRNAQGDLSWLDAVLLFMIFAVTTMGIIMGINSFLVRILKRLKITKFLNRPHWYDEHDDNDNNSAQVSDEDPSILSSDIWKISQFTTYSALRALRWINMMVQLFIMFFFVIMMFMSILDKPVSINIVGESHLLTPVMDYVQHHMGGLSDVLSWGQVRVGATNQQMGAAAQPQSTSAHAQRAANMYYRMQ